LSLRLLGLLYVEDNILIDSLLQNHTRNKWRISMFYKNHTISNFNNTSIHQHVVHNVRSIFFDVFNQDYLTWSEIYESDWPVFSLLDAVVERIRMIKTTLEMSGKDIGITLKTSVVFDELHSILSKGLVPPLPLILNHFTPPSSSRSSPLEAISIYLALAHHGHLEPDVLNGARYVAGETSKLDTQKFLKKTLQTSGKDSFVVDVFNRVALKLSEIFLKNPSSVFTTPHTLFLQLDLFYCTKYSTLSERDLNTSRPVTMALYPHRIGLDGDSRSIRL
jgi:hypothetical protein